MKDLSISQSYLLCVLNEKGKLPSLSTDIPICLLAGGLIDLIYGKSVTVGEDKKLRITGDLDWENQHLTSLYSFIKESKPMKLETLATEYGFSFTDKRLKLLIKDIGMSLVSLGYATTESGGLLGKTPYFIADKKIVDNIIQRIRAELLENGALSDNIIALTSLMEKSNQIKSFFSKYENDQLKQRLKEIKDSDAHKIVKEMLDYITTMITLIVVSGIGH